MRPLNSVRLWRLILLIAVAALISGCDNDAFNPSDRVHSATRPPHQQTPDGVWWYAWPVSGADDEWTFAPGEAFAASGLIKLPSGTHIDLLLSNGKVFRL